MKRVLPLLLVALALLASAPAASAQDTTNVALYTYIEDAACAFRATFDLDGVDSTATYETQAIQVASLNGDSLRFYIAPSADTVGVTLKVGQDLSNLRTVTLAGADTVTTGTYVTVFPDAYKMARYAVFSVGWMPGNAGTARLEAFAPRRTGAPIACPVASQ